MALQYFSKSRVPWCILSRLRGFIEHIARWMLVVTVAGYCETINTRFVIIDVSMIFLKLSCELTCLLIRFFDHVNPDYYPALVFPTLPQKSWATK